jgi:hypothetical protein
MVAHSEGFRRGPDWRSSLVQLVVVAVRFAPLLRKGRLRLFRVTCKYGDQTHHVVQYSSTRPASNSTMQRVLTGVNRQVPQLIHPTPLHYTCITTE